MQTQELERLLIPTREACRILGLSRCQIYRLVQAGKLKAVRIGAKQQSYGIRFHVEEIQRFAKEGSCAR